MLAQLIPIDEVLFVFEAWTLMVRSSFSELLQPETEVLLFDSSKNEIGKAKLNRVLPSKNPEISPIEITVIDKPNNLKDVKFVMSVN